MTISILSQISTSLRPSFSDDLDTVMHWAAFTLAFFGFLRDSEFTYSSPPKHHQSNFYPPDNQTVENRSVSPRYYLDHFEKPLTSLCSERSPRISVLQRNPTNLHEPLFTLKNSEPLTRTVVNSNLRELLNQLGYVDKEYATHSFRIGAATTAAAANLPPWLIKTLGRCRSDCYELYIKTPRSIIDSVPKKLASVLSP